VVAVVLVVRVLAVVRVALVVAVVAVVLVAATRSGLVGRNLTVLDLKTSCRALSASVRWTKTICRRSRVAQPIRKCHESHVSGIGAILILNDPAPSLNAITSDKKSASVPQADGRFDPDKKSAVLRQKIG